MDEVDRLLSRTEKAPQKKEETVVENFARTMRLADTMVATEVSAEEAARVESLAEDDTVVLSDSARLTKERADAVMGVAKADTGDIQISSKTAKQRVSDVLKGLKKVKLQQESEEKTVAFDEPLIPKKKHSMETDENRRKFLEVVEVSEEEEPSEHTRVVERPGFVMKKKPASEKTTDLDIMPTLIEAEDFMNNLEDEEPEKDVVQDLWAEDQIKLVGFETEELEPENVNEFEAEQHLKVKRREKIDKFKLMGIAEAEEESRATNGKLEKLFGEGSNDDKTDTATVKNNPVGVEYTNIKDANRIRATLHKAKRLSAARLLVYALISVIMLVANIVSAAAVGFDATVSHVVNLVLLMVCIVIGMNTINSGVIALLKKQPNLKSSVMLVSAFAFIQCVVSFALEEFFAIETFVISSCAAFAFAADEYGDYLRNARTYDAFNFCTGREKENLHSVQRVENKGDEFEVGRVLLMNKPDVRYSCKTNFPSKLIGRCQSEVSSDKLTALLLPMTFAAAALCAIVAGIFS